MFYCDNSRFRARNQEPQQAIIQAAPGRVTVNSEVSRCLMPAVA